MNDEDFLKELIKRAKRADKGYFQYAHIAAILLPKKLHEQLYQLVNGPIWDGDVVSKSYRDELFEYGLAVRVCVKGEQGFSGANYFAYSVNKAISNIREGKLAP